MTKIEDTIYINFSNVNIVINTAITGVAIFAWPSQMDMWLCAGIISVRTMANLYHLLNRKDKSHLKCG